MAAGGAPRGVLACGQLIVLWKGYASFATFNFAENVLISLCYFSAVFISRIKLYGNPVCQKLFCLKTSIFVKMGRCC